MLVCLVAALATLCSSSLSAEGSIGDAKKLSDGSSVTLVQKAVTVVFYEPGTQNIEFFYVQEQPGVPGPDFKRHDYSGIKVVPDVGVGADVKPADIVTVAGHIYGAQSAECYVSADAVARVDHTDLVSPVSISQKSTAGGSLGLQTGLYWKAVAPPGYGLGLGVVGALVKVRGKLLWGGAENNHYVYYIDDGSGIRSTADHNGMKVICWSGSQMPNWWVTNPPRYVEVIGVLGAEYGEGGLPVPVLRVDSTPSSQPVVNNEGWQNTYSDRLHASWLPSEDADSGLVKYDYAIGRLPYPDPLYNIIRDWTSVGTLTEMTATGLNLLQGDFYFVSIRATNGAGLMSYGSSSALLPQIQTTNITTPEGPSSVPQYDKYEARFDISSSWSGIPVTDFNPFCPKLLPSGEGSQTWRKKGMYVDALFTKPGGATIRWPCFYDYSRGWRVRFAPTVVGTWSCQIEARYRSGSQPEDPVSVTNSPVVTFECTANTNPITGRGFLRKDSIDPWFFSFSNADFSSSADDTVFYPFGVKCNWTGDITQLADNGGTYSRLFRASRMFEQKYTSGDNDRVNSFSEFESLWWDSFIETARQRGVYLIYLLNDWTRWKDPVDNPYLREQVATDTENLYSPTNTIMREVYKRKLRFILARWGYSTSIIGFDTVNETSQGTGSDFHNDMARFVNGDPAAVPAEWPVAQNDAEEQPHHLSGDHTSCEYRSKDVEWSNPAIGMCHYHDYACSTEYWNGVRTDIGTGWDTMGSGLGRPWYDSALWMDRMARLQHQLVATNPGYAKPFSWTEYGLANAGHTGDWNDAYFGSLDGGATYAGDTGGRHARDWFWAAIFNKVSGCHWLPGYFDGAASDGRPGSGVTQWWIFRPLSNFLKSGNVVDMRGMTQESYYWTNNPSDPNTRIWVKNSNGTDAKNVEVYGVRNATKVYLYVKNMTATWYKAAGFSDATLPTPTQQTNITVTVKGLTAGTYRVEKWSTTDTNPGTQRKSSQDITIGTGQTLSFVTTLGATVDYAWAYKIYRL